MHSIITPQDKTLGWVLIFTFAYMGFAVNWHYIGGTDESLNIWMFGSKPVLLVSILVLLFFFDRHVRFGLSEAPLNYSEKRTFRHNAMLVAVFFIAVLLGRMVPSPNEHQFDVAEYWALFEMPLWAFLGYAYVSNLKKAEWWFERLSTIIAIGSVVSFGLRIVLGGEPVYRFLGPAGWPMRFFFMFGFCWYFVKYFSGHKDKKITLGLLACSLETIATLHKPFIVACSFAIPIMLILIGKRQKWSMQMVRRFVVSVAIAVAGIVILNLITQGALGTFIENEIAVKYLKSRNEAGQLLWWSPEDAYIYLSGSRLARWPIAFERFYDDPMLGSGLGQTMEFSNVQLVSLHNGYLDLLLSFGILGCIPVLVGLIQWLKQLSNSALSRRPEALYSIAFLGYILAVMVFDTTGTSRIFFPSSFFIFFAFGAALRLAVASSSNPHLGATATASNR